MNHLFRVVLVLCLAVAAVTALIISNNRANPRPAHQLAGEEYAAYRRATIPTLTVRQYVEARLPQNFRADMSKLSFGKAAYYATDRRYDQSNDQLTRAGVWPATITTTVVSTQTTGYGGMPMPYPPNDLWCAQLSSSDPNAPSVILIALHQDIYNAEWVVHEVTDPATVLPAVGCQFSTQ